MVRVTKIATGALSLLFWLCLASAQAAETPPTFNARAWLLIDHDSGQVLAEHNADRPLPPASLTKLMVAYLVFEKLRAGALRPDEPVRIGERAWNTNGERLFLRPDATVPLEDLLKGMIVRSANDAAIALAEHVSGSEPRFVAAMNESARVLGLAHTRFTNVTGLDSRDGGGTTSGTKEVERRRATAGMPEVEQRRATPRTEEVERRREQPPEQLPEQPPRAASGDRRDAGGRATPGDSKDGGGRAASGTAAGAVAGTAAEDREGHVSTARDLARLASQLVRDFPDDYRRFALREFTWQDIRQYNRNALLWRDDTVDGVKTGQTKTAGWCLIASARRNHMRLIATVLGAKDDNSRFDAAQRLLDYGFRHYETRLLYAVDVPATRVRVWLGDDSELPLGVGRNLYLTLPRGDHEKLRARLTVQDMQAAPIRRGQPVGKLVLELDQKPYAEYPLVALKEIREGNALQRSWDKLRLWLQ